MKNLLSGRVKFHDSHLLTLAIRQKCLSCIIFTGILFLVFISAVKTKAIESEEKIINDNLHPDLKTVESCISKTKEQNSAQTPDSFLPPSAGVFIADIHKCKIVYTRNERIVRDEKLPFGSIIKPFTLYYAVSRGKTDEKKIYYCAPSHIDEPPFSRCWFTPGHRRLNCIQALAQSCNRAFMKIASSLDYRDFVAFLNVLGFDTSPIARIEEPLERRMVFTGLKDYLQERASELALKMVTLLENGEVYSVTSEGTLQISAFLPVSKKASKIVRKGMLMSSIEGHSAPAPAERFIPDKIFSKTGTIGYHPLLNANCRGAKNNGLFVAYVVSSTGKYVVAVVLPCGRGDDAAAAGRRLIAWLTDRGTGR